MKKRNSLNCWTTPISIGARYDREYKITKEQLKELSEYVSKVHEVTQKACKEKIESFG